MSHAKCIRSHYIFLMKNIDCEHGLLGYLYADDVISYVEKEVSKRTVTSEIANPVLKGPLSILCVFECFLRLGKFLKRVPIHHKKKCRSSYEACIFRMREKNYASFLGAVFFTVFGRDLPWLPKIILPRLVLLSPLPIVAFFFLMKNFKKIID